MARTRIVPIAVVLRTSSSKTFPTQAVDSFDGAISPLLPSARCNKEGG